MSLSKAKPAAKKTKTNKPQLKSFTAAHVERAHDFGGGRISFTCTFDGTITIYNMMYVEGTKDGKDYAFVTMPQTKGKDGNYYNMCYSPITDALQDDIIKQLADLLDTGGLPFDDRG